MGLSKKVKDTFNNILGKDKKRYSILLSYLEDKEYVTLFSMDTDGNFGLELDSMITSFKKSFEDHLFDNPNLACIMIIRKYERADYYIKRAIDRDFSFLENLIRNMFFSDFPSKYIVYALDNGYVPSTSFLENYFIFFNNDEVMCALLDKGIEISDKLLEQNNFSDVVINKLLDTGYIPSEAFLVSTRALDRESINERLLSTIEINSKIINGPAFATPGIQRHIVKNHQDWMLKYDVRSQKFWYEAFKTGYMPDGPVSDFNICSGHYDMCCAVVREDPSKVVLSNIYEIDDNPKGSKDMLDELSVAMGYVPTMDDLRSKPYISKSKVLMKVLLENHPEAIKKINCEDFGDVVDLCRFAVKHGFVPVLDDVLENPKLGLSFDVMNLLIHQDASNIVYVNKNNSSFEELFKLAVNLGYDGTVCFDEDSPLYIDYYNSDNNDCALLNSEYYYMYMYEKHPEKFDRILSLIHPDWFSLDFLHFLKDHNADINKYISFFDTSYESLVEIVSDNPSLVSKVKCSFISGLSRKDINSLCTIAYEKGFRPSTVEEAKPFFSSTTAAIPIIKEHPEWFPEMSMFECTLGDKTMNKISCYDELCQIAYDSGCEYDDSLLIHKISASYLFMKDYVKKDPFSLTFCRIENQEEFEEVCRIAFENGYRLSEYDSTQNTKLPESFTIMNEFLERFPDYITKVRVSDPEKKMLLIDKAIACGYNLYYATENDLYRIFSTIDRSFWKKYLNDSQIEKIDNFCKLLNINSSVVNTLSTNFACSDVISDLTMQQIEVISCYPRIQEQLIKLSPSKRRVVIDILNKYKENMEWVNIIGKCLDNIDKSMFSNLFMELEDKELSPKELSFLFNLLLSDNYLSITSYDELKDFDAIKEKYINDLAQKNTLGSLKSAYLCKVYGIDLAGAIDLIKKYGKSLDSDEYLKLDEESKEEFSLLSNIRTIVETRDIDLIKYYYEHINPSFKVEPDLMLTYESRLKNVFVKEFNKSIYKPLEEDKLEEDNFDVYFAGGKDGSHKFGLMITSIGAYTNLPEPDDYYSSWNVNSIASHGVCCSYLNEQNLGTARVKYCCLGFSDYALGSLHVSAPYDLCSSSSESKFKIDTMYPTQYLLPGDIPLNTRHTHNETVWERRELSGNGTFKKQPSYVVFFCDNYEDRINNPEYAKQWESCKKAAKDFGGLPIVVVEREKIAKNQVQILNDNLAKFNETLDIDLIKDIIVRYESNYAGNRDYNINISENYFPRKLLLSDSYCGKILEIINANMELNPEKCKDCLYELEKVLNEELDKYLNTKHGVGQANPSFPISEALHKVDELQGRFLPMKKSVFESIESSKDKSVMFEKADKLDEQLSHEDIHVDVELLDRIFKEIDEEKINASLKINGSRHVKNVCLFASLIGKELISDSHDFELLMIASKYHDVVRVVDNNHPLGRECAKYVCEKFESILSPEDLKILNAVLTYLNYPRGEYCATMDNGWEFQDLSEDLLRRASLIGEILKDSDALDRTRFVSNKKRLNPDLLHFDYSKKLVRFSATINEEYALQDLKEYDCDEYIEVLLKKYSPQELLNKIRTNTNGEEDFDTVRKYIVSLASTMDTDVIKSSSSTLQTVKVNFANEERKSVLVNLMEAKGTVQYEKTDAEVERFAKQYEPSEMLEILKNTGASADLIRIENEIYDEGVNKGMRAHNQQHIIDVVMYSALIGKEVIKDPHYYDLLLIASKYHDCGRSSDAGESHAVTSCEKARSLLEGKLSEEDINIVSVLILFHEVPRCLSDFLEFDDLCKEYNIPDDKKEFVKEAAEVLKDADALDRTRFVNGARLNPRLLHFDYSRKFVKSSSMLQEGMALQELYKLDLGDGLTKILETKSPQEVLRALRNGDMKKEDIIKLGGESFGV